MGSLPSSSREMPELAVKFACGLLLPFSGWPRPKEVGQQKYSEDDHPDDRNISRNCLRVVVGFALLVRHLLQLTLTAPDDH